MEKKKNEDSPDKKSIKKYMENKIEFHNTKLIIIY